MLSSNMIVQERYRILRLLGQGGMGTVYEALDERLSRTVALKEARVEGEELKRAFEREAKLLANLQHAALPRVMDHFGEDDTRFLVMEFIPGDDLAKVLAQRGSPFPVDDVLRWGDHLLDALEYLHGHVPPVLHRDIKPSNLKLTAKGQVILLDFGLAKGAAGQMSLSENSLSVAGYSPNYAPLEQIQGERTSSQSDLYSLAATLYQLLTNRKPADALKRATAVIHGEPDPLVHINELCPELPGNVAATLMQSLSQQPARRPASAAAMRLALSNIHRGSFPRATSQASLPLVPPTSDDEATEVRPSLRNDEAQPVESMEGASQTQVTLPETLTRYAAAEDQPAGGYQLPGVDLLNAPVKDVEQSDEGLRNRARRLSEMFSALRVHGKIVYIKPGPVLTTYEFQPDPGIKYTRVTGLADDICLALRAPYTKIERVPHTSHIGIQIPNERRETVYLRQLIESISFRESASRLTVAMGLTTEGAYYLADLNKLPHLLIAGATGAGKSVFINTLILSILFKARPDEVKLILVDPKRVELGLYRDIPHLATPVITDPKRASVALKWAVAEMERRFREMAAWGVRNLEDFNAEVLRRNAAVDYDPNGEPWKPLPYIVIVIDELADLMMAHPDEVEESLTILARKERAVGIHLVLATQRPSAEVITGPIKANFPARLSFHVASKADSRIILDTNGAEDLLGSGDMLFLPPRQEIVRLHGAYVDEGEIGRVVAFIKLQGGPLDDRAAFLTGEELPAPDTLAERDEFYEDALRICVEMKRASTTVLQRRLRIGYGRAQAILDQFEREVLIGQADGARPRPLTGRAYEVVAQWYEVEKGMTSRKADTPPLESGSIEAQPKTGAERVAEFMKETEAGRSVMPGTGNDSKAHDSAHRKTSQGSKRKGSWWNSLFGGDEG
jgi:serine/threonine protein kinase